MMVSLDTNILVYATILAPLAKTHRALCNGRRH